MFEEMGDAGLAQWIVGRAVAVPDHMGDDGRAAIGDDDDVEAVGEPRLERWRGRRRRRRRFPRRRQGGRRERGARAAAIWSGDIRFIAFQRFLLEVILASRSGPRSLPSLAQDLKAS